MTLAEILDEGERLEGVRVAAAQHRDYSGGVAAEGNLIDFYIRNGVRLLAVARAAMEAERLLRHALDESSGAVDSYEALWIMQSAAREAVAAFDSAAGAREGEGR